MRNRCMCSTSLFCVARTPLLVFQRISIFGLKLNGWDKFPETGYHCTCLIVVVHLVLGVNKAEDVRLSIAVNSICYHKSGITADYQTSYFDG